MKRIISLLLSILLLMSLSVAVFADEGADKVNDEKELKVEAAGITFHLPDAFCNTTGALVPEVDTSILGIYFVRFVYAALPEAEYTALIEKQSNGLLAEEYERLEKAVSYPCIVIRLDENRTFEDLNRLYLGYYNEACAKQIYQEGETTCYLYADPDQNKLTAAALEEPYQGEFSAILDAMDKLADGAEYYDPVNSFESWQVSFEATDLEGNTITSEDLFSKNHINLVHIWQSWLPENILQVSELDELNKRLTENKCGIVSVLSVEGSNKAAEQAGAKQALAGKEVSFPVVIGPDNLPELLPYELVFPTAFFVDSEGNVLSDPIQGIFIDLYEEQANRLLLAKGE